MPNNTPRTPVRPPRGLRLPNQVPPRPNQRTPDPQNGSNNNFFRNNNVARALNFNNTPMTPPPRSPREGNNNRPMLSPSPATKKKRLEEVQATNYLAKYANMLNNKKNFNTINKNTKNFNVETPVFLLSDVYESKDGKVKNIYSEEYLRNAWKNRTILKSPVTGVRTKEELIVRFNPRLHHEKVIATPTQLQKYKDNKNLLVATVGEEAFIDDFLVKVIKNKLPYVMKFIKVINKKYSHFGIYAQYILGIPRQTLSNLHIVNLTKLTKKEVDKIMKINDKLVKQLTNFPVPGNMRPATVNDIYKVMYAQYLRCKIIMEYNESSIRGLYQLLKRQAHLKNVIPLANLSIFKNELKNLL